MNINILSMQRVVNYGSFLQAYALKKVLEEKGNTVSFIDIIEGEKIEKIQDANQKQRLHRILTQNIKQTIGQRKAKIKFAKCYNEFIKEKLEITEQLIYNKKSDMTIIGSDEVFNCTSASPWGVSMQLFGENIDSKKIITYAASFGNTTLKDIEENNLTLKLIKALKNVDDISVRDENSRKIIEKILGREVPIVVDPTLLYDFTNDTKNVKIKEKDYIIIYAYPGRFKDKKEIESIKMFAKKKNLKLIALGYYQYWCDKNLVLNPFEYVAYMKKAKYIITDTFHGTIFAIKSQKQFCTFVRESNKNKLEYLLNMFELDNRIVYNTKELKNIIEMPINYQKVNDLIAKKRIEGINFLENNIKEEKR